MPIKLDIDEIRILMIKRKIPYQKDLAQACGMSKQHLSDLFRRSSYEGVTLGTVDKLCEALHCDISAIVQRISKDLPREEVSDTAMEREESWSGEESRPKRRYSPVAVDSDPPG